MVKQQRVEATQLEEILNNASDLTDGRSTYVNNIRFHVSNSDITLDFYHLAIDPQNPEGQPIAHRTHRIVIPLGLGKNIAELLIEAVARWEETMGVSLPIMPQQVETQGEKEDGVS